MASALGGSINGTIGLTNPRPYVVRGCLGGKFTFTRNTVSTAALPVNYIITGTAVNGVDYATIPSSVTIPANTLSTDLLINPLLGPTGTKNVKLLLYSSSPCSSSNTIVDSVTLDIRDSLSADVLTPDTTICFGIPSQIRAVGDTLLTYNWSPVNGVGSTTTRNTIITPTTTTTYVLTASLPGSSCPSVKDSLKITVPAGLSTIGSNSPVCIGNTLSLQSAPIPERSTPGPGLIALHQLPRTQL